MSEHPLRDVVDELYSLPPAEFTPRRTALATAARKDGDRELAKQIAALRKPTRSADALNKWVRTDSDGLDDLLDLGSRLRLAQASLDAPSMRALTEQRRNLISDLTRRAFEIAGSEPSSSVREEVVGTFNAALADERVAENLQSGSLVTQARWDGFGTLSLPELAAVIPLDRPRRRPVVADQARPAKVDPPPRSISRTPSRRNEVARPDRAEADAKAATDAEREAEREARARAATTRADAATAKAKAEAHRKVVESAERDLAAAEKTLATSETRQRTLAEEISSLERRLGDLRTELIAAQREIRTAGPAVRAARMALTRLRR